MPALVENYLEYHKKYTKIYGESKTLVLMQVGTFYEAYQSDKEGPDLLNISKILSTYRSKKGKDKPVSKHDPYFMGFPVVSLVKFLEKLMEVDYTVIIIDQIYNEKRSKKGEERKVTNIYSKGTYIDNITNNDSNYQMNVFFSLDLQKDSNSLMSVGISATDVSTGSVLIHEAYSSKYDEYYALDETDRFIESYNPKEICIYFQDNTKAIKLNNKQENKINYKSKIFDYLKLDYDSCKFYEEINKKYTNCVTQNEILRKVYKKDSIRDPIEYLSLERNIYATISLVSLFDDIYNKNPTLLNNMQDPQIFINNQNLILGNNAISQLEVIEKKNNAKSKSQFTSLFSVVNNTSTAMGERFLKNRLLSPLLNINDINKSFDMIETTIESKCLNDLEYNLNNIKDIERLQKKIECKLAKPIELSYLISSYEYVIKLIELIKNNISKLNTILPSDDIQKLIPEFEQYINNVFNKEELFKFVNYELDTQIFKIGQYKNLDVLFDNESQSIIKIEKIRDALSDLLNENLNPKKNNLIALKTTAKSGSHLKLTKSKTDILKKILFDDKVPLIIDSKEFDVTQLNFLEMTTNNVKITLKSSNSDKSDIKSTDPKKIRDSIIRLNKEYFLSHLSILFLKFSNMFVELNKFISIIDFVKSNAKTAVMYGYSRPTLVSKKYGWINATKLRHPIVERLISHEYVPHDVNLGKDLKGMMIYGLNSAGKSIFMKSLGLAVIMAQSGLFVPCEKMELSPYNSLYTRITGDDNIFRGLSSFTLEMLELNAILKRANNKTMVIGDEVCRGTEHISGNALVASTLMTLSESKSTFIFASHLHEIMNLDEIKQLHNLKAFHISVSYDEKSKTLIFDRQMKEGSGEQIYGVTVAQYIIQDKNFIDLAIKFRNKLTGSYEGLTSGKTSRYNSNVLIDECKLCGSKKGLESHHINFQKDCVDGLVKNKKHLLKNSEANLIVLCSKCHDSIHSGNIFLDKYVASSKEKTILIKDTKIKT